MTKLGFNLVVRIALAALSLVIFASITLTLWQKSKIETLTLAAGAPSGESYLLGNALKKVVERHYPRIRIALLETGGTVDNLQMLNSGRAQLAAAQADVLPGPRARAVAVLYNDAFQLLVPEKSTLRAFADLRAASGLPWQPVEDSFSRFCGSRSTSAFIEQISFLSAPMTRTRMLFS